MNAKELIKLLEALPEDQKEIPIVYPFAKGQMLTVDAVEMQPDVIYGGIQAGGQGNVIVLY